MAKSGQKRAFEDETVQTTRPSEELRVSDRRAVDVTGNIDAEYNRSGMWFNPDFFNSLATISNDIHDTRRLSRQYDFKVDLYKNALANRREEEEYAKLLKDKADLYIYDEQMEMLARTEEEKVKASRLGENFTDKLPALEEGFDKRIQTLGKESPYIEESLKKYKNSLMLQTTHSAIQSDATMNQQKALIRMSEFTAIQSNQISLGKQSLDGAITELPSMIIPLSQVAQVEAQKAMNESYNTLILQRAEYIAALTKHPNPNLRLSVAEAQDALTQLLVDYRQNQVEGPRDPRIPDEKDTYHLWMEPKTGDAIQKLSADLDKNKVKKETIAVAQDFLNMIDYDVWKGGDNFDKSPYLRGTSVEKFHSDWVKSRTPLVEAMLDGDTNASKELYKIDTAYFKGRTLMGVRDMYSMQIADLGSAEARKRLKDTQEALLADLNKGQVGQFRNTPSYMIYDNGRTRINMGFPNDKEFSDYLKQYSEQDEDTLRYNYYKDTYNFITKILQVENVSDKIAMMDSEYSQYSNRLDNALTVQNLVSTDSEGHTVLNMEGINQLAALMLEGENIARKANNGAYVGAPTSSVLTSFAKKVNAMTPEIKAQAIRGYAMACIKAGNYGGLVEALLSSNLSSDAKAVIRQASVYSLYAPMKNSEGLSNSVARLQISKTFTNTNVATAEQQLKKHGFNNFSATLEKKMAGQVPAEFKQAVRDAAAQMYLSDLETHLEDKNYDKYNVDQSKLDELISANFKDGVYLHANSLKGVDVNQLAEDAKASSKEVRTGLNKLGIRPGEVTSKVNYRAKAEEIYVNGEPLYLVGAGGPLEGSSLIPFKLHFDNKPTAMPQDKYNRSHTTILTGATMLAALSDIRSSSKMQSYMREWGNGISIDNVEDLTYQMMAELNNEETQNDWHAYYNSNFTNTKVVSAPADFKKLAVEILMRGFGEKTKGVVTRDQANHFVDFLYTRMSNGRSARLDMPMSTYAQGQGVPLYSIQDGLRASGYGYRISPNGLNTGDHAKNSLHYSNMAIDIGFEGGFLSQALNSDGTLNYEKFEALYTNVLQPLAKSGELQYVRTAYHELLDGRVGDKRFAKLRNLRNKDGQRVFQYAGDHDDHYHLELYNKWTNGKPPSQDTSDPKYIRDIANVIKTNVKGIYTEKDARACAIQGVHYTATIDDAERMGKSLAVLNSNPGYRAQAYASKFNYFRNALNGSTNNAVAAMAGCKFYIYDINTTGIPSSVKLPFKAGESISADTLIKIMSAVPHNALKYRVAAADTSKYQKAINQWIKDGK